MSKVTCALRSTFFLWKKYTGLELTLIARASFTSSFKYWLARFLDIFRFSLMSLAVNCFNSFVEKFRLIFSRYP